MSPLPPYEANPTLLESGGAAAHFTPVAAAESAVNTKSLAPTETATGTPAPDATRILPLATNVANATLLASGGTAAHATPPPANASAVNTVPSAPTDVNVNAPAAEPETTAPLPVKSVASTNVVPTLAKNSATVIFLLVPEGAIDVSLTSTTVNKSSLAVVAPVSAPRSVIRKSGISQLLPK